MTYITELNETNYDSFVSEGLVLVDIWATWCGPCKMLHPIIDEISNDYCGKIKVGKFDADINMDRVTNMGITNIPTILIYKNGELLEKKTGSIGKNVIVNLIEEYI